MYSLLSGLYRYMTEKVQYQVLVLGLDYAGKTTLKEQCQRIFGDKNKLGTPSIIQERMTPTVGLNIGKLEIGNTKLLLWDLGGQEGLRVIWQNYYAESHAIMYVVDATDTHRLREAHSELKSLLSEKSLEGAPLLLLANKQDMKGAKDEKYIAQFMDSDTFARERKIKVLGISAKQGTKVKDAINWLLKEIPICHRTSQVKLESL
ncbi:hypothetical protein AAMO2058_000288600 [Amorphochlora amoebiformis]